MNKQRGFRPRTNLGRSASLMTLLLCMTTMSPAATSWVQTASGQDHSDVGASVLHVEFVQPRSVTFIRGNYRQAFVKVLYTPPVSGMPGQAAVATTISYAMVNCNDLSWGDESLIAFDKNMEPVSSSTGDFDQSKPIWTLKNMEKLTPADITYRTAQYICRQNTAVQ